MSPPRCKHRRPSPKRRKALLVLARLQQPEATGIWSVALGVIGVACETCGAPAGVFCTQLRATDTPRRITLHHARFVLSGGTWTVDGKDNLHWPDCTLYAGCEWIEFNET